MLKHIPILFLILTVPYINASEVSKDSLEVNVIVQEIIEVEEMDEADLANTYVVDDLIDFNKNDLIESDAFAVDEEGEEYYGVVNIQDFLGYGILLNENNDELPISIRFLEDGKMEISSEEQENLMVEILNFRIVEADEL